MAKVYRVLVKKQGSRSEGVWAPDAASLAEAVVAYENWEKRPGKDAVLAFGVFSRGEWTEGDHADLFEFLRLCEPIPEVVEYGSILTPAEAEAFND